MHKRPASLALFLFLLVSAASPAAAAPGNGDPLDHRYYPSGKLLWIWSPHNIMLYRDDTKSLKTMTLSRSAENDSVLDIAENSDVLWVLARSGLYQIDMNTSTIEPIPGGPSGGAGGKVAADIDYAWVAKNDTLWKFDKLGREWFGYGLGPNASKDGAIIGAYSSGEKVYCITGSNVLLFSIADEKWSAYPLNAVSLSPAARLYPGAQTLLLVDQDKIYRYIMSKLSWDVVTAPSAVIDLQYSDELIHFLTRNGAFEYTASTAALRKFDIADTRSFRCLSLLNDTTVVLAGEKSIAQYITTSRSFEYIPYPPRLAGSYPEKIIKGDILLYQDKLTVYNRSTKTWELFEVPRALAHAGALTWDDRSLRLRYGQHVEEQLHGHITQRLKLIDGGKLLDSNGILDRVFFYSPAKLGDDLYANLNSHTALAGDRYIDGVFKKETGRLPEKSLFYRGERDDYLESARLGASTLTLPQSQTLPSVQYEGANAIVHSKNELATRDRKIVRAQAGTGLRTSRTVHSVLIYNKEGRYSIAGIDSTKPLMILPGSLRINVDGEEIDTMQYSIVPSTGELIFNRRDLLDPSSVILATYKVQTTPDSGLGVVELIPKNHFGQMQHASATLSPTEWLSVQTNYASVRPMVDTLDSAMEESSHEGPRRHIANVLVPMEFRRDRQRLLLKMTPELSYETAAGAAAGAFALQSRLGDWLLGKSTSLFFDANFIDTAFTSTDVLSRGYGKTKGGTSLKVTHDILTELPLSFTRSDRVSEYGTENYTEAAAGMHFQGLPKIDLVVSNNTIDADNTPAFRSDSTADTLVMERNKSKIKLRLYEPSSPAVQSFLHFNKVSYDLSYSRFSSRKESDLEPWDTLVNKDPPQPGGGAITYASVSLSPIASLTLSGLLTAKTNVQDSLIDSTNTLQLQRVENIPYLMLQAIDAIPGFDINGIYSADYASQAYIDTVHHYDSGRVKIQRQFLVIVKPSTWTKYLYWISPRFGLSADLACRFDTLARATAASVFFGTRGRQEFNLTKRFGAHFHPTNDILFRQENAYSTSASRIGNPVSNFYSFNDLKWWFGANRLWQTRLEYNDITTDTLFTDSLIVPVTVTPGDTLALNRKNVYKMFTFFDANWSSWLHTNEKLAADFTRFDSSFVVLDSSGGANVYRWQTTRMERFTFGPELMVSFNVQQAGPIKLLVNGHSGKVTWTQENGRMKKGSSFSYSTFTELIVKPNVSFETNHALTWAPGILTYNGDLSVSLLF
ncbi:MAG: hypothetical protein JXA71_19690 [Chitinispirillaceae bacterium]|nr:hypothetical protein [Chitinispirillaceae bacterium]